MKQGKKKKKDTEITLDELMAEADKFRVTTFRLDELTPEQREFLKYCREGQRRVPWITIVQIWNKKWAATTLGTLKAMYNRIRQEEAMK